MSRLELLKELCKERGITINKLEQELGFSQGSLGKIDSSVPKADKLYLIARFFDVPMEAFLDPNYIWSKNDHTYSKEEVSKPNDMVMKLLGDKDLYLLIERIINSTDDERERFVQMGKLMGLL